MLAVVLVLGQGYCCASANKEDSKDLKEIKKEYILSVLKEYISTSVDRDDVVNVSNEFIIQGHNDANARLILVKKNSHCIGELLISTISRNRYISSFYEINSAILDEWLAESKPLGFFLINDVLAIQSDDCYVLLGNGDEQKYPAYNSMDIQQVTCKWEQIYFCVRSNTSDCKQYCGACNCPAGCRTW